MRLPNIATLIPCTAAMAFALVTYHSLPLCEKVSVTELSSIYGGDPPNNLKCQKTVKCGFDCYENPPGSGLCESCEGGDVTFCQYDGRQQYNCTCENQVDGNGNYVKCGTKKTGTKGFFGCSGACRGRGPDCGGFLMMNFGANNTPCP
jgi:hypothetical protein